MLRLVEAAGIALKLDFTLWQRVRYVLAVEGVFMVKI
jgi:hypothetical protein